MNIGLFINILEIYCYVRQNDSKLIEKALSGELRLSFPAGEIKALLVFFFLTEKLL